MQLRLSTREDNPTHTKGSKGLEVGSEVVRRDLAHLPDSPDVAHQASTIAAIVRKENEDGKAANPVVYR